MELLLKLRWYFLEQWRRYAIAIAMFIGVDILEMCIPWITGRVIDHVVAGTLTPSLLQRYAFAVIGLPVAVYVMRFLWRVPPFHSPVHLAVTLFRRLYPHLPRRSP